MTATGQAMGAGGDRPEGKGDLSVTALYTSETWRWGVFDGAELLALPQARVVFRITNLVLGMVRLFRWELPLLRHSLVQRHAMIDHLLRDSGVAQVLELAAGLSRRGASLTRDRGVRYTEVDLPSMVALKRDLLGRTPAGREVAARTNLRLVAGDARTLPLEPLVDAPGPLFVVAEGLCMYLPAPEQRALWSRVAALLAARPGSVFVFDLTPACEQPRPGLLGRMLAAMMRRFTRGKTFEVDGRTRDDIRGELLGLGFGAVDMLEPRTAPASWNLPFMRKKTQVLLFVCRPAAGQGSPWPTEGSGGRPLSIRPSTSRPLFPK